MTSMEDTALHTKYRPKNLDEVIGHEKVVSSLKGIVEKGKWPSAIAFFGPTSAGKTTLAHALVSSAVGAPALGYPDFTELNAADSKTIEDVRELIRISKLRPSRGVRRFILVDEAQGLLSNPQAAAALLKPLEQPPASTTWILGSMDPSKFESTQNGKAMANRCQQFILKPPSDEDLHKQARRIMKGEGITFISKEQREILVSTCNREMRSLANLIQGAASYHVGMGKNAPAVLSDEDLAEVLSQSQSDDVVSAVRFLTCIYNHKFVAAQREILNVADGFGMINKLLNLNWFLLNDAVLKGARHPNVWANPASLKLKQQVGELQTMKAIPLMQQVERYGLVQSALSRLKAQSQAFAVNESMALSEFAFSTIQNLKIACGE